MVEKIIAKERPDALLPTMGGQTALNASLALEASGVLAKYGVEMIGAKAEVIDKAEDRQKFRDAMDKIGLECPRSRVAHTMEEALAAQEFVGLPSIIRPSFTLAGTGGGIAYNRRGIPRDRERGLDASPTHEVLIEESVLGWKEYRDGGGARQGGQLHHRLLHREHRPDGRAHRRLHHRAPGADPDRQGIPAHAHRLDRGAARDRGGDRRLQRAVRGQSRRTGAWW